MKKILTTLLLTVTTLSFTGCSMWSEERDYPPPPPHAPPTNPSLIKLKQQLTSIKNDSSIVELSANKYKSSPPIDVATRVAKHTCAQCKMETPLKGIDAYTYEDKSDLQQKIAKLNEISKKKKLGIRFYLDSTEYCTHCIPIANNRYFYLMMSYPYSSDNHANMTHAAKLYPEDDLNMMILFLDTGLPYHVDADGKSTTHGKVQQEIDRIEELLGLST